MAKQQSLQSCIRNRPDEAVGKAKNIVRDLDLKCVASKRKVLDTSDLANQDFEGPATLATARSLKACAEME